MTYQNSTYDSYDYGYTTDASGHHHQYLLPILLRFLNEIQPEKNKKLRILDIGR